MYREHISSWIALRTQNDAPQFAQGTQDRNGSKSAAEQPAHRAFLGFRCSSESRLGLCSCVVGQLGASFCREMMQQHASTEGPHSISSSARTSSE
jgi:hypothetical protein